MFSAVDKTLIEFSFTCAKMLFECVTYRASVEIEEASGVFLSLLYHLNWVC